IALDPATSLGAALVANSLPIPTEREASLPPGSPIGEKPGGNFAAPSVMAIRITRDQPSTWRGVLAGAVAGLGAAWVMNQFQAAIASVKADDSQAGQSDDNATTRAADAVAHGLLRRDLTPEEKQSAGAAVHYAFGSTMGALYGATAEVAPAAAPGAGVAF